MSKARRLLARKIGITLFLLAFPLFVLCLGTFFNRVQVLLHEKALERTTSILNTTMLEVAGFMNAVQTAANSNAWLVEENFTPEALQAMSRRIVTLNGSVYSCTISTEPNALPQSGHYFSVYTVNEGDTILTMLEPEFDYTDRVWYRSAVQSGKARWVDPFSDFHEGSINTTDAVGSYSVPLRPHGDRIEGVLSTDFSFSRLTEIILNTELPFPSAYYMLLSEDGRYLMHPETRRLFKKTIFSDNDAPDVIALGREMVAGKQGTMHVVNHGVKYHVCYAPVPGTNWSLALVCHDEEVLTDFYHLTYLVVIIVIIGLFLILWLATRVVNRNFKPLNQLLEATRRIAEGNYEGEMIARTNRKDVISTLQNSFAMMQEALISHRKSISSMTEELKKENEELERATRHAAETSNEKRLFYRHVLYQIKTPLDVINGLTYVALDNIIAQRDMENVAETMKLNATRLIRRISMLYDSSDEQASNSQQYARENNVLCNRIAQESIEMVANVNPKMGARLVSEVSDDTSIQTNESYLRRSIIEIVLNAYKFSDGLHITLRITETETTVNFIVEDVGPGMPAESKDLFNKPFAKVDPESQGLGVGLPLVKRHITNLGGEVILDTTYQQGCRITLVLPK